MGIKLGSDGVAQHARSRSEEDRVVNEILSFRFELEQQRATVATHGS
jgi:hypothetical protein